MEKENVKSAPAKMKNGKTFESSGVVTKIFFASGDVGLERIASLFKCTLKKTPGDWNTSITVYTVSSIQVK